MSTLKNDITPDDHTLGNENASVTLVEYGDYQCPDCRTVHPVIKKVQKQFGDKLRFVFRNFPLSQKHQFAEPAAEAAEFAAEHKKFWEMHDLIFELQPKLSPGLLVELGETLDLPPQELQMAIVNKKYDTKIQKDFLGGVRSGVNGTPTFFINGQRYDGAKDFDALVQAINPLLQGR